MRTARVAAGGGAEIIQTLDRVLGISYPMLVSLSHAKEQYKRGEPFKADFDEFVRGLLFYSEMLFDYHGERMKFF